MEIDQLEAYHFTENKEEFLQTLVPGTQNYFFFKFVHLQNLNQMESKEYKSLLEQYEEYIKKEESVEEIDMRINFFKYENSKNEEIKKEVIENLDKNFIHLNFDYEKPKNVATTKLKL